MNPWIWSRSSPKSLWLSCHSNSPVNQSWFDFYVHHPNYSSSIYHSYTRPRQVLLMADERWCCKAGAPPPLPMQRCGMSIFWCLFFNWVWRSQLISTQPKSKMYLTEWEKLFDAAFSGSSSGHRSQPHWPRVKSDPQHGSHACRIGGFQLNRSWLAKGAK